MPGPPDPHGVPGTAPQPTRAASRRGWVVCRFTSSSPCPKGHRELIDPVVWGLVTPRCQCWFCRNPFPTLNWGLVWGVGFVWLGWAVCPDSPSQHFPVGFLTSQRGFQSPALALHWRVLARPLGWQLEPTEGGIPGGICGMQQAWLDQAHPSRLGASIRQEGGKEMEEIPKLLSRERVTTEEKMPQRSDCPLGNTRLGRRHTATAVGRDGTPGCGRASPGKP